MNRNEFMKQLERLLLDIPEGDRLDALKYYNDYFDEAGVERECEVIRELGSPGKVAAIIKADLNENNTAHIEHAVEGYKPPKKKRNIPWALVIILLIFALPVLGGVFGTLLGMVGAIFGILVAIFACGVAFLLSAIACIVVGVLRVITSPVEGLLLLGGGCVLLAVGLLATILFIWIVFKWLPALFRGCVNLFQKIFYR